MGFRIALENAEQCQVNGTAGECHTDTHIQNVHQHIGQTSQHAVYSIHQRSHKQEGEFQRLGDAGNHRSQCCGEQQASNHLFLFRTSRTVHGKCRSRQTEDHERELAETENSVVDLDASSAKKMFCAPETMLPSIIMEPPSSVCQNGI